MCTDHRFSLPVTSRFSTPGGFWPHMCSSQFSPPHPLAPSPSPCLRLSQFAPSLVSPVASTNTPTMTEHFHLLCGGLWLFRQASTASRSLAQGLAVFQQQQGCGPTTAGYCGRQQLPSPTCSMCSIHPSVPKQRHRCRLHDLRTDRNNPLSVKCPKSP